MEKIFRWLINKFLSKKLDFRVRLFNVLAMAGTLISILMSLISIFNKMNFFNAIWNLLIAALSFGLLYFSYHTGKYKICYLITTSTIFLGMFSVLFFRSGGYHGGMILFFVFAVLFTVFMLEGKIMAVMAFLEVIVYTSLCIWAYFHPEQIHFFDTERDLLIDILTSFLTVSIVLGITMFLHFGMYNEQQKELEKARKRLAEENIALEEINRLKTEFLGNVSHELKTPLTVVSGYAQTTRQLFECSGEIDKEEVIHKMKLISSEAERLAMMVGQVLEITRIEEGHMLIEKAACHPDEVVYEAIETHYPILNKNANRLDIYMEDNLPMVEADSARISQVIINLISNAIRFTINGNIIVSAKAKESQVLICVSDTGRGISQEKLPFIFERYNNNQKENNGHNTGTGLGLFICKHIIEEHGGDIWVESEEGKGTDFFFTLPAL